MLVVTKTELGDVRLLDDVDVDVEALLVLPLLSGDDLGDCGTEDERERSRT